MEEEKKDGEKVQKEKRREEEKKKMIVFRVHGNSDFGRSKTYGSICFAHDPINHEN